MADNELSNIKIRSRLWEYQTWRPYCKETNANQACRDRMYLLEVVRRRDKRIEELEKELRAQRERTGVHAPNCDMDEDCTCGAQA